MFTGLLKQIAVSTMNGEGGKLRKKDANNTGADDAGGRALELMATAVDSIDFDHISDAKSLTNIGKTLEAIGKRLQEEAAQA